MKNYLFEPLHIGCFSITTYLYTTCYKYYIIQATFYKYNYRRYSTYFNQNKRERVEDSGQTADCRKYKCKD